MIKQIIYLVTAAFMIPLSAGADNDGFLVHLKDGAKTGFGYSEISKIVFDDGRFVVLDCDGRQNGTFFFENVQKITLNEQVTGIDDVNVSEGVSEFSITADRSRIVVGGIGASAHYDMRIYSVSGTLIRSARHYSGSDIDISFLPAGMYILYVNNNTFKFKK